MVAQPLDYTFRCDQGMQKDILRTVDQELSLKGTVLTRGINNYTHISNLTQDYEVSRAVGAGRAGEKAVDKLRVMDMI
jgi:hypothetical protein